MLTVAKVPPQGRGSDLWNRVGATAAVFPAGREITRGRGPGSDFHPKGALVWVQAPRFFVG